ncbi:sigma-54 dependent transcriptional regulator [bacterium]|nr:sigma-54 dependent transcriptional regulator [bacterium]
MIKKKILIAEDEEIARDNLEHILKKDGYDAVAVENGMKAMQLLKQTEFDLVITDLKMPDINGIQLLEAVKDKHPETEVLVITGYATVATAVQAMQKGAYSYIPKPFKIDELRILVQRALEKRALFQEVGRLRLQIKESAFPTIIGQSSKMKALKESIAQIAAVDCNVLIFGETGTGKEMIARSIHNLSPRSKNRFMAINCASFTEELLGNELFGHEAGAFTGAKGSKKGLLEVADGGTFFLDEIGDMPLSMQAKLLRVLEERTLIKLGGTDEIPVNLRILAATNKDLKEEVENERFRKDLYYRLNVVNLIIPPLIDRKEDIPLLSYHFLELHKKAMDKKVESISDDVIRILENYEFPGNVRELENIIERAVVMCDGNTILVNHLPSDLKTPNINLTRMAGNEWLTLADNEKDYIEAVLKHTDGNKTKASQILGIDRVSLWRKLNRYNIETEG